MLLWHDVCVLFIDFNLLSLGVCGFDIVIAVLLWVSFMWLVRFGCLVGCRGFIG